MIVNSATGDVDLGQPENVRRGMVFRVDGAPWVATQRDEYFGWGDSGVWCGNPGRDFAFLGCDPARADRADCERFGLAPGVDAGAHGFARTRDGFAVDLRAAHRLPAGMVIDCRGKRETLSGNGGYLHKDARFIGLNAAHASAEDMERLCCGAHRNKPLPGAYLVDAARCALAIGHDGDHEALALGVKWAAEHTVTITSKHKAERAALCGRRAQPGEALADMQTGERRKATGAEVCTASVHGPGPCFDIDAGPEGSFFSPDVARIDEIAMARRNPPREPVVAPVAQSDGEWQLAGPPPGVVRAAAMARLMTGFAKRDRGELGDALEVRDAADAERLFGKGSSIMEGDGTGFPGLRKMLTAPLNLKAAQAKLDAEAGRVPRRAPADDKREIPIVPLPQGASSVFAKALRGAEEEVRKALSGPTFRGIPFPDQEIVRRATLPRCAACDVELADRHPMRLAAKGKNDPDVMLAFTVCEGCGERLRGADLAHKNGRLVWRFPGGDPPAIGAPEADWRAWFGRFAGESFAPPDGSPAWFAKLFAAARVSGEVDRAHAGPGTLRIRTDGDARFRSALARWIQDNSPLDMRVDVTSFADDPERVKAEARQALESDPRPLTIHGVPGAGAPADPPDPAAEFAALQRMYPDLAAAMERAAWWHGIAAWDVTEQMLEEDRRDRWSIAAALLLAWACALWDATPQGQRAAREAPLVALVAAVPEGLNPVGWRAAVLAVAERYPEMIAHAAAKMSAAVQRHVAGRTEPENGTSVAYAVAAYRRALAPHKAPPPERKTRGPRLTVDDGRDE